MFDSIRSKLDTLRGKIKSVAQKARHTFGSPKIWGTVAVFSPTLVACYGTPFDQDSFHTFAYEQVDCIDGYLQLTKTIHRSGSELTMYTGLYQGSKEIECQAKLEQREQDKLICNECHVKHNYVNEICYADCRNIDPEREILDCSDTGTCKTDCQENSVEPCNPSCSRNTLLFWNQDQVSTSVPPVIALECHGECIQAEHYAWCRHKDSNSTPAPRSAENPIDPPSE